MLIQESHVIRVLRDADHRKGEMWFLRSGASGAGGAFGSLEIRVVGDGRSVSKVR